MYGKKVKFRAIFLIATLTTLILTIFLIIKSLEENVVYFISPTEIIEMSEITDRKIRIGGMVKKGSISADSNITNFIITDFKNDIFVSYDGLIPNLFAEEKGVVAEGYLKDKKFFVAKKILKNNYENYIPPEVKEAIKND